MPWVQPTLYLPCIRSIDFLIWFCVFLSMKTKVHKHFFNLLHTKCNRTYLKFFKKNLPADRQMSQNPQFWTTQNWTLPSKFFCPKPLPETYRRREEVKFLICPPTYKFGYCLPWSVTCPSKMGTSKQDFRNASIPLHIHHHHIVHTILFKKGLISLYKCPSTTFRSKKQLFPSKTPP